MKKSIVTAAFTAMTASGLAMATVAGQARLQDEQSAPAAPQISLQTGKTEAPAFPFASDEGGWQIVLGGIPVNLNLDKKNPDMPATFNGIASFMNHNYLEIRGPDDMIYRRLQAQEVHMQGSGHMWAASYGSYAVPFAQDQILRDDPHQTMPNALRHGYDPRQVGPVFVGTQREVLIIYHQMLVSMADLNNRDLTYSALGQNGNQFTASILLTGQTAAYQNGLNMTQFDPHGWDIGFDGKKMDPIKGQRVCPEPDLDDLNIRHAIEMLENHIGAQHAETLVKPTADLNMPVPEALMLRCR